ncbi:hypothetical protein GGX14DRAFT_386664 [Mycena pura]|uniref:Uncharacterized protein n=1 Tax=Mycena pura TaxID=153505 RepID=A0AAD7E3X4_9AGAR|nr:hypothetical protein GGX14DRAFT_386664 [Mycena pura]
MDCLQPMLQGRTNCLAVEVERVRRMPPEIESTLPSPLHSPTGFHMCCSLPVWNPVYDAMEEGIRDFADMAFDTAAPTFDTAVLAEIPLLRLSTIQRLKKDFGQAFLDGNISIRDARDVKNIYSLPLWYLTYAERARQAAHSWHTREGGQTM